MKFSDILSEVKGDYDEDRLNKKGELIYKALKTGIITIKKRDNTDLIKFKYVLPDWHNITIKNRMGQYMPEIFVESLSYQVVGGDKESMISHHLTVLFSLIQRKFLRFNVFLDTEAFIMNFNDLDGNSEQVNEAIANKHEDWDDESRRVKKKVYTILKAHQRGVITVPSLKGDRKYRYEFIDTLLGDIKGLGMTLSFTSSFDKDTNHLILHPQLKLRDVYVKIWDENDKQIDVTSFEFDGMDKSLVLHKIGDRLRVFDIKVNWGWTKSDKKWD